MSIISLICVGLLGWLIYRVIQPQRLKWSPASLSTMWILGVGFIYVIYNVSISLFRQNPPPLLILIFGGMGLLDMIRSRQHITVMGWQDFRQAKVLTFLLVLIIIGMSIHIFMTGFYADTNRMWLAKADILNQLPDYFPLFESIEAEMHPDYPMMIPHLYQWQLVWANDLFSLKLSTWVWYVALLLASLNLFSRWTSRPILWLILLAGFPAYWFVVPMATLDIPLSMMWVAAFVWLLRYLEGDTQAKFIVALIGGIIILTKNEGILIIGCIVTGLLVTAFLQSAQRKAILQVIGWLVLVSGLGFFSWYGLMVGQADVAIGSDFGLSGFQWERLPELLEFGLPTLFNPLETAFIWGIFLLFLLLGYWDTPLLWLPVLLYLGIISVSYMFSIRPGGLYPHIIQSYFRLILHITPLAMVYIARCLSTSSPSAENE